MSGRRIDDHSFWAGKGSRESVFPMGAKVKTENSPEGSGNVSRYEDTTETIKSQQEMGIRKVKSHPMKTGHRH